MPDTTHEFPVVHAKFNDLHAYLFHAAESTPTERRCLTGSEQDELHRIAQEVDSLHHRYMDVVDPPDEPHK